jgi:hypothetical protein
MGSCWSVHDSNKSIPVRRFRLQPAPIETLIEHPDISHLVRLELSPAHRASAVTLARHLIPEQPRLTVCDAVEMGLNLPIVPVVVKADKLLFVNCLTNRIFLFHMHSL